MLDLELILCLLFTVKNHELTRETTYHLILLIFSTSHGANIGSATLPLLLTLSAFPINPRLAIQ